jgi:cytoskeletal protein RodZ
MNKILIGVIVVLVIIVIIMGIILWKKGQKPKPISSFPEIARDQYTSSVQQSDVPHETSST